MFTCSIEMDGVSFHVPGKTILRNLSLTIERGTFTVVTGENGAGKTTLLKLFMGFSEPSEGVIRVLGKEPKLDPFKDRHEIAYLAERLSPPVDWSVNEYLTFHRFFYPSYSIEKEKSLLDTFRIDRKARIGQLSTGERRRVQIVGGLSLSPRLLIIDEITAVLDIVARTQLMGLLKEIREAGGTVLMATNIIDDVDTYATHLLLLHEGRLLHHQSRNKFLEAVKAPSMALGIANAIKQTLGNTL